MSCWDLCALEMFNYIPIIYTDLNVLNLEIIYSKKKNVKFAVRLFFKLSYKWNFTHKFGSNFRNFNTVLPKIREKKEQNSSSVFAKYFCNHYNYIQRVVFAPVTLLAKSVPGQWLILQVTWTSLCVCTSIVQHILTCISKAQTRIYICN